MKIYVEAVNFNINNKNKNNNNNFLMGPKN